jgi:hypothetical protein
MFFETLPGADGNTQRVTYRIEGAPAPPEAERGALVHIEQRAILEEDPGADPIPGSLRGLAEPPGRVSPHDKRDRAATGSDAPLGARDVGRAGAALRVGSDSPTATPRRGG